MEQDYAFILQKKFIHTASYIEKLSMINGCSLNVRKIASSLLMLPFAYFFEQPLTFGHF